VPAPKPTAPLTAPAKKAAPAVAAPSDLPKVGATIETPQPLGKRAAKKVMMEQMSQPEVLPTHAPDAAKATFSAPHERVVIMPTAQAFAVKKDLKRVDNWKKLSLDALTDADILAMPDSEYMNDVQLAFFRRKLSALKADMLANAGETTEHLREDTVVVPDPADRATIEEEHALELRTRDRERKLLKKIEQSISRIDANDYGYCDETGEPIGVPRLLARPTASLSLEAQQRRELKQKMFGD
jgi:DnaK suppressor protein